MRHAREGAVERWLATSRRVGRGDATVCRQRVGESNRPRRDQARPASPLAHCVHSGARVGTRARGCANQLFVVPPRARRDSRVRAPRRGTRTYLSHAARLSYCTGVLLRRPWQAVWPRVVLLGVLYFKGSAGGSGSARADSRSAEHRLLPGLAPPVARARQ